MKILIPREVVEQLAGAKRKIRLGDLVRRVTTALGIAPCDGCKKREKSLNRFELNL